MIKVTLLAAALAVALTLGSAAQAQGTASPAKKELVAKVLQLQQPGIDGLARNLTEQPALQMMQQAGPVLQRLPAERRDAAARDVEADVRKYVEEATPIVRDRANKLAPSTMGALLDERFSEDELRQLVAFLESPVTKKFQSTFPEMLRSLSEKLIADTRGEVELKLRTMQASVSARLGVAPASAPKAAASAAPATKK